jgi:4-amino-4-deoxy-L-arabinose transferase-like glycosyltransferase
MTTPFQPVAPTGAPYLPVEPQAGTGARVAGALGALIVLLGGALFSLGVVFFAPLGMLIGAAIWRKRGRVLSMVGHWLAALIGVAIVVAGFAAVTSAFVPKGSFDQMRHTMDSATAVAAAQRAARGTPADSAAAVAARRASGSSRGMAVMLAYGFGFVGILMVLFFGTVGWIGGMLLGFANKGRWPGYVPQPSVGYAVGHA